MGGKVNRFIPNPTFDPVSKPGALIDYFRGKTSMGDLHSAFGELDPINPAYRDPAARVKVMDEQGLRGAFLFPTLGVGMETLAGARPSGAAGRVPRLQPLAARRLVLRLPGPSARRRRT